MNRLKRFILPLFAVVLGIIALVVGIRTNATKHLYDASVKATVVDVVEDYVPAADENETDRFEKNAYITYEVNGVKYENVESPYNNDDVQIGDEVEILYQSQNPEKYAATNNATAGIIFIVVGAVVTFAGLAGAVITFLRRR